MSFVGSRSLINCMYHALVAVVIPEPSHSNAKAVYILSSDEMSVVFVTQNRFVPDKDLCGQNV